MAFALKKLKAEVTHLNVREEMHGEDPVLACDVKIKGDISNAFLDQLSPGLRSALFAKEGAQAGETPDMDAEHLAVLRFPQIPTLKWTVGLVAGKFTLHGSKKSEDLEFECDVKECSLACKEGGTVELTFQAAVLPTSEESGRLAGLLGHDVKVSVEQVALPDSPPVES